MDPANALPKDNEDYLEPTSIGTNHNNNYYVLNQGSSDYNSSLAESELDIVVRVPNSFLQETKSVNSSSVMDNNKNKTLALHQQKGFTDLLSGGYVYPEGVRSTPNVNMIDSTDHLPGSVTPYSISPPRKRLNPLFTDNEDYADRKGLKKKNSCCCPYSLMAVTSILALSTLILFVLIIQGFFENEPLQEIIAAEPLRDSTDDVDYLKLEFHELRNELTALKSKNDYLEQKLQNYMESLNRSMSSLNSSLSNRMEVVTGPRGLEGKQGIDGKAGETGLTGPPGVAGPPGDFSQCRYRMATAGGFPPKVTTKEIPDEEEEINYVVTGISCSMSTNGQVYLRPKVHNVNGKEKSRFSCHCFDDGNDTVFCNIHYWQCPLNS